MKRALTVLVLLIIVTPSIAFASWWNPRTWKIFQRLSKKTDVEQVKLTENTNEQIQKLQEQIEDLKNEKLADSTKATGTVGTPKVNTPTVATPKASNYNFLVIQLNESLVSSVQNQIDLNNELKAILQSRQQRSLQLKDSFQSHVYESVPKGVNVPNDLYRAIVTQYANDAELSRLSALKVGAILKGLNEIVLNFNKFKAIELTKSYTKEEAILKMEDMMKVYSDLDKILKLTQSTYEEYIVSSQKTDSLVTQAVSALQKNADEYALSNSLPKQVFEPIKQVVIPKIELPRTTYCHVSYTGIQGSYDVSCN